MYYRVISALNEIINLSWEEQYGRCDVWDEGLSGKASLSLKLRPESQVELDKWKVARVSRRGNSMCKGPEDWMKSPLRLERGGQRTQWQKILRREVGRDFLFTFEKQFGCGSLCEAFPGHHPVRIYSPSSVASICFACRVYGQGCTCLSPQHYSKQNPRQGIYLIHLCLLYSLVHNDQDKVTIR